MSVPTDVFGRDNTKGTELPINKSNGSYTFSAIGGTSLRKAQDDLCEDRL
jgi:hypothetical protein